MIRLTWEEFREMAQRMQKAPKYGNKRVELDGHVFDSAKEARRYAELKTRLLAGEIHDLKLQEPYELIPELRDENGKVVQRAVNYYADFTYLDNDGTGWAKVVEDVKGCKTDVYKLKRKIMRWKYGIEIMET